MNNKPMNEREEHALDALITASLLPQTDSNDVSDKDIESAMRGEFPVPEEVNLDRIRKTLTENQVEPIMPNSSIVSEEAFALFRKHREQPVSEETQAKINRLREEVKKRRAQKANDKPKA